MRTCLPSRDGRREGQRCRDVRAEEPGLIEGVMNAWLGVSVGDYRVSTLGNSLRVVLLQEAKKLVSNAGQLPRFWFGRAPDARRVPRAFSGSGSPCLRPVIASELRRVPR